MFATDSTGITGIRIGSFSNYYEAAQIFRNIVQLNKVYGHVSLADVLDLCGENTTHDEDAKIGWTEDAFKNAEIKAYYEGYSISMPKYDWFNNASMIRASDELLQPEPINITIPAEKPELIKETINSLCNNLEIMKDHPVFINFIVSERY